MQAKKTHALVKVELSKTCKGKPRRKPVWVMRYVLPSGKDSRKVLRPAWTRKGRPANGDLTESDAQVKAEACAAQHWAWKTQKVESEGKLQFYTPEQVRKLVAEAYSEMDEAIYTLATEAGPRLSEIRGLKVGNIDFEAGVLRFEDGFTTTGGHAGNKGRRVRSVPMTRNVRKALAPFCEGKSREMLVFEHEAKPLKLQILSPLHADAKYALAGRVRIGLDLLFLRHPGVERSHGPSAEQIVIELADERLDRKALGDCPLEVVVL
jgi:hypothetical protein